MNREAQSLLVVLFGGLLTAITVSGKYTSYVKPGFGPLLLVAGVLLVLVGVVSLLVTVRQEVRRTRLAAGGGHAHGDEGAHGAAAGQDAHGHDHDRSRAPWLVLAPVLVLLLVSPAALGADAVARNAGSQGLAGLAPVAPSAAGATVYDGYKPNDGSGTAGGSGAAGRRTLPFQPLPQGSNPVITVKDFVMRAIYDGTDSVVTTPVTVVGFVAPAGDGYPSGWTIARMAISCCAADATPIRMHVDGQPPAPVNGWVAAVVTAEPNTATEENNYVPTVTVHSVEQVQQPTDPYEH